MDVAAMSIQLNQMKLHQDAGVAVLKMAMDHAALSTEDMQKLMETSRQTMEQSIDPHLGANLDVYL
ncbi:Putative motility protein [Natronincola peptidivorans]|uniref:Putative motility protein n=1 Tax=Natronincola peptidivorans TaxID=426128 RepID=A0A1H9ZWC0_9FIRM|nr:YjfB family protein [Natronincola peptidivorans]SES85168.1 Putative motility protein [Natronincola peptidivorans]